MTAIPLRTPVLAAPGDRSFWLQDIGAKPVTKPLEGAHRTDIAIVGGGYTGLWTALRLRALAPESSVTVLEAGTCGCGASGRNGGQVHSWYAEIDALTSVVGIEEAQRLCAATAEAIEELAELQASGTIDMDLRLRGWLWTASSTAQEGAWDSAVEMTEKCATNTFRPLSAEEILQRTGSPVSYLGVSEERAGSLQPAKLALGLRDLAISRGVKIHEGSVVRNIVPGTPCELQTGIGTLTADTLVLATNAWLSCIPELHRHMFTVQSQVIATEPTGPFLDRLGLQEGVAVCDSQRQVIYYQRDQNGRLIFGHGSGRICYNDAFGAEFNRSKEGGRDNRAELKRLYPDLRDTRITHDWAGPIDCTPDHVPACGSLTGHRNIIFGLGLNGTGIAQAPVVARILASMALGRSDEWSRSGLVGLAQRRTLPPEPIRYIGARIVRAAVRRRNAAEIRNRQPNPLVRYLSDLVSGHEQKS